ncbi:MAG: hypothetical protein K1X44_04925 [Alphaproteobacteria bacterium]|nr:hypothetical protein [Alphaproteobacteria bacterium]
MKTIRNLFLVLAFLVPTFAFAHTGVINQPTHGVKTSQLASNFCDNLPPWKADFCND